MKIILVTGATGHQGGAVVRHLLQTGEFLVQALVRNKQGDKAQALMRAGAFLKQGDFNDRASLDAALQGVHGVFSIQDFREGPEVEVRQGITLADAAKAAGVSHFVYSSVGSAERNTGIPHFESKFKIEKHIRTLQLPYTIIRPVFFMYNYESMRQMIEGGTLYLPLSPDTVLQQLSEDDFGRMIVKVFQQPESYKDRSIELASTAITLLDVAAAFSQVMGKKTSYQQIPFGAFEQKAGEEVTTMFRWFEEVGYDADIKALSQEFGHLSNLETYLHRHDWAPPVLGNISTV
ncbi:MAG: NmrA/HSCARG family protein [Chitinophagaceae bacterium]|nr:NmrA/HSCARG family protein [Chitinophagaceae bacterium]